MNICIEHNTNAELLFAAIDSAGEKYLKEATEYEPPSRRIKHLRLLIAAVIAAVAVFLMGAGVLVYHEGIAEQLRLEQEIITGREISDEVYEDMIESEQYLGITESVNDLTITIDSATVTDFRINVLIKVEGSDEKYPLEGCSARMYGSFIDFSTGGLSYDGVHSDGATYYVAHTTYDYIGDPDATELDVTLKITKGEGEDRTEICSIDFTVDRVPGETIEVIPEGESVAVTVRMRYMDWAGEFATDGVITEIFYDIITRDVTDITLSEGGMYITYDNDTAVLPDTFGVDKYYIDIEYDGGFDSVYVVMKDGTMIMPVEGGTTESVLGQSVITRRYVWSSAINLDNVAYIRIGFTEIPVNAEESGITDEDVTVSVEKAVTDESDIYLLLRVESDVIEGSCENMNFGSSQLITDEASISSIEYTAMKGDEDGVYYVLLRSEYTLTNPNVSVLDCELELENLHTDYLESDDMLIVGNWSFEFSAHIDSIETVNLTTDASGISELEITEFGCTFTYDFTFSDSPWAPTDVTIVTKDGKEIHTASAEIEYYREDVDGISKIVTGYRTFIWETPVSIDEVDYIYFTDEFETDGVKVEVR